MSGEWLVGSVGGFTLVAIAIICGSFTRGRRKVAFAFAGLAIVAVVGVLFSWLE